MPLWDSVQRSLEKATQEAARIAKAQRVRANIDGLYRQMGVEGNNLVNKTMELFNKGQITQSDLLPFCQELANLKQQIDDAQNELKQLQPSQPVTPPGQPGGPAVYPPSGPLDPTVYAPPPIVGSGELPPTVYAPPPPGYQSYLDSNNDATPPPPPPPGMEALTVSAMETVMMDAGNPPPVPAVDKRLCSACGTEVAPEFAFCHNCGTPVQSTESFHAPTTRGSTMESIPLGGEETVRAETADGSDA